MTVPMTVPVAALSGTLKKDGKTSGGLILDVAVEVAAAEPLGEVEAALERDAVIDAAGVGDEELVEEPDEEAVLEAAPVRDADSDDAGVSDEAAVKVTNTIGLLEAVCEAVSEAAAVCDERAIEEPDAVADGEPVAEE